MRVLITGGTGFIGRALGKELVRRGHEVVVLARNPEKTRLPYPAAVYAWDGSKSMPPSEALIDVEAVVNLAGESLAARRWTAEYKQKLRRSRVDSTRYLVEALAREKAPVKKFIGISAVGYYGDTGDQVQTEDALPGSDFLARLCRDWENETKKVAEQLLQPSWTIFRLGVVLGEGGGMLAELGPVFRRGLGGRLGHGRQWMSWIYIEDLVHLFTRALETESYKGVFNAVAPEPVQNKNFVKMLGLHLNVPTFMTAPAWGLKLVLGEMSFMLLGGQRVSCEKLENQGFQFEVGNLDLALRRSLPQQGPQERYFLREQWLPDSASRIFAFLARSDQLLPAPQMSVETLASDQEIKAYLKVAGVRWPWRGLITEWELNRGFTHTQIKGPFQKWVHIHKLEELAGGTLIREEVYYKVPLGKIGRFILEPWADKVVTDFLSERQKQREQKFSLRYPNALSETDSNGKNPQSQG